MDSQDIQNALDQLRVNSKGHIRGQMKVIDKIHSMHLKKLDSEFMDIRIFVAKTSTGYSTKEVLKMIDNFIYNKQIK